MHLKSSLVSALLIATHCFTQIWACGPLPRRAEGTSEQSEMTYPYTVPGDDLPSDPATTGYFINHLCINVRNTTESINWYNKAFGLRLMFTLQASEHFAISYMGHSHGGRNGTGYQTSEEMNRQKNNIEGLIEMLNLDYADWDLPSGIRAPNTFSHIGMVVPNITDTQARLEAMDANIIKGAGETFTLDGAFADGTGFTQAGDAISQEEIDLIMQTLVPINTPLILVADPDGNVIEVQNQEGSAVVQ